MTFYCKSLKPSFLTMSIVKIGYILPKQKNRDPIFLYVVKQVRIYQEIDEKLKKCRGQIYSFLPWNWKWNYSPWNCVSPQISTFGPRHICFILVLLIMQTNRYYAKKVGVTLSGLLKISALKSCFPKNVLNTWFKISCLNEL